MTWLKSLNLRQKKRCPDDDLLSSNCNIRSPKNVGDTRTRSAACDSDDSVSSRQTQVRSNYFAQLVSADRPRQDDQPSSTPTTTRVCCPLRLSMAPKSEEKPPSYATASECQLSSGRAEHERGPSGRYLINSRPSPASQAENCATAARGMSAWARAANCPQLIVVILAWCLLASCALAASSSQQYFEVQPDPTNSIPMGQDVRLRCLVRNQQGECAWIRNGQVIGFIKNKYNYARQPQDGDCSLLIRNASVQLDDGQWQCQVLATELDQPSLQSRQVSLVVLVPPEKPQFKDLQPGAQKLVIEENNTKFVVCEIRGGNPSPQIEWILDGKNISKEAQTSIIQQPNSAAAGQIHANKITQSKLKLADIKRQMNGKNLTCVGVHQTLSQSASVELDVQYVPTVNVGQREYSIVEGSPLSISCQVDSNPAPTLINWRLVSEGPPTLTTTKNRLDQAASSNWKSSASQPAVSNGPILEFQHIDRNSNQDVYECLAQNQHGISQPMGVKLNVLFAPAVLNSSQSPESVAVGSNAQLQCLFEGNPEPEIRWFYTDPLSKSGQLMQLDNDKRSSLLIKNVTYRNEGDYYCEAKNYINGQFYSVRSSNILLDIFGEPQFLLKSPQTAKAIQGTKSDVSLKFCSDPPAHKIYWQFGSIRLDVRLNNQQQQQPAAAQVAPPSGSPANNKLNHQSSVLQRFQAQPLQPIQRKESHFSKTQTCFEATLTLLDPELTDQRDYTLNVFNERGHQSGTVRLRVSSPLSPVLMITSAFVTICGLFLCSLLFVFVFKKKSHQQQQGHFLNGRRQRATNGTGNTANGPMSNQDSQRSPNGTARSGQNEKAKLNGKANGLATATGGAATADSLANGDDQQAAQQMGIVNGTGNGLANGASNPSNTANHADDCSLTDHETSPIKENKVELSQQQQAALQMMSMASSDTSCNDQKQLLANCSDRNSASSNNSSSLNHHHHHRMQHHLQQQNVDDTFNHRLSAASNSTDRSTANSTPSPMNHISVDDELNLNVTYQATESVTRGAQLSPMLNSNSNNNNGLIYANLDSFNNESPTTMTLSRSNLMNSYQRPSLRRQQQPSVVNNNNNGEQQQSSPNSSISSQQQHKSATSQTSSRPSVGATIAMMNSLAAAAASAGGPQSPINSPAGILNGALNQQLAMNNQRASQSVRKPGPPKPPKPSIQQRSRFYQQQVANSGGGGTNGLVMIQQQNHDQQVNPNDLAIEYSKIAFPARADL